MRTYSGLTWDHPRGYNGLAAAAVARSGIDAVSVSWEKQPLEGFETHPIADLCARYDIVVMDHPHVGEAYDAGCLQPLEAIFSPEVLAEIARNCIGPTFDSYRFAGKHWALPLDAATQVSVYRPDLLSSPAPVTWEEVVALSRSTGRVGLSLAGPHAICSFMSIAAAFGFPPAADDPDLFVSKEVGREAYEILAELAALSPAPLREMNPIAILGHMASHDDVLLCPLIYGYVNYAAPAAGLHRVAFANAPRMAAGGRPGSTLGGTGIGISVRCEVTPELKRHLLWLMGAEAQVEFLPAHDGQPSLRRAWHDAAVNARWGDFYKDTAETLEKAYVRPRHSGYIAFQGAASAYLRRSFGDSLAAGQVIEGLQDLYTRHRPVAGGER
jgi:multiple sugar transport system substrate-binding protein